MRTIIKTYDGDIYIIENKSQKEVREMMIGAEWVQMPNGDSIRPGTVSTIQSDESYTFQSEQKSRHKKGQYIEDGEWHDVNGPIGHKAELESISGEILKLTPPK